MDTRLSSNGGPTVSIDRGTLAEAFGSDLETYYSRELMHIVGTGPK